MDKSQQKAKGPGTRSGRLIRVSMRSGRVVIPAEVRKDLGVDADAELVGSVEEGRLVLQSAEQAHQRLWSLFADVKTSMAAQLSRERRKEARAEAAED